MGDQPDETLTIHEAAACRKAGKPKVYWPASSGKILPFKLGGTWRFRCAKPDPWIAIRTDKATDLASKGTET